MDGAWLEAEYGDRFTIEDEVDLGAEAHEDQLPVDPLDIDGGTEEMMQELALFGPFDDCDW